MALTGCAGNPITPEDIMARSPRTDHVLARAPRAAAECMVWNVANFKSYLGLSGHSHEGEQPGTFEFLVRVDGQVTIMFAKVSPAGGGTQATVWLNPDDYNLRPGLLAATVKGC